MIADSAAAALVLSGVAGSIPARRSSRRSSRRKFRASITAVTRPSPSGSKAQPAAIAGATSSSSTAPAATKIRDALLVITLLFVQPVPVCRASTALLSENATQGRNLAQVIRPFDHAGQFLLVASEALNHGVEHHVGIELFEIERMAGVVIDCVIHDLGIRPCDKTAQWPGDIPPLTIPCVQRRPPVASSLASAGCPRRR